MAVLKQAEAGTPVPDLCREHGASTATFYKWRAKIGGMARGVREHYDVTYYQSTHVQGGVIMSASPESGVVNPWLQHWDMQNLWITGGSSFPQNGSGNPTLTMLAATYRAADAFVDRYIKKPGVLA